MRKKLLISLLIGLFSTQICFSQIELGGTFGAGITNNYLTIDIAPEISYTAFTHWNIGVSPFFIYNSHLSSSYWSKMYGGRIFTQYRFDFNIFVHAEFEVAHVSNSEGASKILNALPLGVGGFTSITENTEAYAMVLYDVLYDEAWATRTNPMFRIGVRYKF